MNQQKRRSGGLRRALLWIFAGVGLTAGLMTWAVWPYVMYTPSTPDPAFLARLESLRPAEHGPNRWDEFAALVTDELGFEGRTFSDGSRGRALGLPFHFRDLQERSWGDPGLEKQRRAMEALADVLARLDEILEAGSLAFPLRRDRDPFSKGPDEAVAWGSMWSLYRPLTFLADVNSGAMRSAAERCDWPEFERRLLTGLQLAAPALSDPDPESWAISYAIQHGAVIEALRLIDELDIPPDVTLRALATVEAEEWRWQEINAERGVEAARLIAHDRARRWFAGSGVADLPRFDRRWRDDLPWVDTSAPLDGPPTWMERVANVRAMMYPTYASIAAKIDADHDAQLKEAQDEDVESLWKRMDALRNDMSSESDDPAHRDWPTEFEAAAHPSGGVVEFQLRPVGMATSCLRALAMSFRLECHRAMHGRWPERLEDAMPESAAIEPRSGLPMAYFRLKQDGPGRGYDLLAPKEATFAKGLMRGEARDWRTNWIINSERRQEELSWEERLREDGELPPE